jgi:hypothetical protein
LTKFPAIQAILAGDDEYEAFVLNFLSNMFPEHDIPLWAVEALATVNIRVTTTLTAQSVTSTTAEDVEQEGAPLGDE